MMTIARSAAVLALVLAACARGDEPDDPPVAADSAQAAQPATVGDAADSAPPAAVPAASAEPAEQDTMLTRWRPLDFPSEPWEQSAADAPALLRRIRDVVAAQLEEPDASVLPTRMETQAADSAIGMLVHPDQADDSVRDIEFRFHMRRDGAVWRVTGVDRRERCRRGVAAGGLCA